MITRTSPLKKLPTVTIGGSSFSKRKQAFSA
jgi:hypothetical protein